ncbi:MAG: SCO6745 family protein [Acidimicrobiales bacterium]
MDPTTQSARARALAGAIEPVAGQVYFSPECHEAYARLGFSPSSRAAPGVAMPDGPAYFCSRGSVLGQVPGEVVASAFAVFNPAVVIPAVNHGRGIADAATLASARTEGALGQLRRVLGAEPPGAERAAELLQRASADLRVEGRPLYAGMLAQTVPADPLGAAWRLADRIREFRGDVHIASWTTAGFDAVEIGLLTELYWNLRARTYIRTRAWTDGDMDAAEERLVRRGLLADARLTDAGRAEREAVERATDGSCQPIIEALGDNLDELLAILRPWGQAIRGAAGYPASGPHDLADLSGR